MRFFILFLVLLALGACNQIDSGFYQKESAQFNYSLLEDEGDEVYPNQSNSYDEGNYMSNVEDSTSLGGFTSNQVLAQNGKEPKKKRKIDVSAGRKLVKEGNLHFKTENLEETHNRILAVVHSFGGYCEKDEQSTHNFSSVQDMKIRLPSVHFDELVKERGKGVKKFDSKEISVKDFSETFTDLSARVKTKLELEQRYLDLLKKAHEVKDVIVIENEINDLRTDIERIQGKLNHLSKRVRLSTLTVRFYEEGERDVLFAENRFLTAFKGGWDILVGVTVGVVYLWPLFLICGILFFVARYKLKGRKTTG